MLAGLALTPDDIATRQAADGREWNTPVWLARCCVFRTNVARRAASERNRPWERDGQWMSRQRL
jgi:hypothetical protein